MLWDSSTTVGRQRSCLVRVPPVADCNCFLSESKGNKRSRGANGFSEGFILLSIPRIDTPSLRDSKFCRKKKKKSLELSESSYELRVKDKVFYITQGTWSDVKIPFKSWKGLQGITPRRVRKYTILSKSVEHFYVGLTHPNPTPDLSEVKIVRGSTLVRSTTTRVLV